MEVEEAIEIFEDILKKKDVIDKIKDNEEREIEYSAYFEDMPFEAIETVLENRENMKADLHDMYMSYKHMKENWTCKSTLNLYVSRDKIREKIKELYKQDEEWTEELSEPDSNFKNIDLNLKRIKNQIDILEELLNESEEK